MKCRCGHDKDEHDRDNRGRKGFGECLFRRHIGSWPPDVCCCRGFVEDDSHKTNKEKKDE